MRKPSSGRPSQAPLQATLEEMRQGIDRLTKRLADVSAFEPTSVTQQNNIPHVEALAASVDDSLRRTFGADMLDSRNYSDAAFFDNGPFNYAFQVPISQVHASLSRSKARSIALLTQAIKSLEERLAECRDASSLESEFPPPRFSRRTVIAAVEVIEGGITHVDLTRRLLKWNAELNTRCDAGSLPDRFNHLIKFFDERPHFRLDDGVMLADELVEHAVSMLGQSLAPSLKVDAFRRTLDLDGFSVMDGMLRRTLPSTLKLPEAADEISQLLTKHGFAVAQGHLKQASDNHVDGNWAAANSQIRSFLDGLLDEIAVRITPSAANLPSGQPRRMELAKESFFIRELNEWDDHGLGFINGLVKRLHPHGSHPGLSDQDDCSFRLHTVLLTARLLLVRFDARS